MAATEPIDQDASDFKTKDAKPRRRAATAPARKDGKRSLNLRIDHESHGKLAIHALRRNTTISALVEGFAREHLREFSIHRNAPSTRGE